MSSPANDVRSAPTSKRTDQRGEDLAHSIAVAARRLGISRSKLYEEIRAGRIVSKKSGKRTLITVDAQRAWLDALPTGRSKPSA